MKKIFISLMLIAGFSANAFAGNCDYSWQKDKAGHSCGGRAADQREGGN